MKIRDQYSLIEEVQDSWCDWNLYKQLLFNIITNAIKYSRQGGNIVVGLESIIENKEEDLQDIYLVTKVFNEGPTIASEKLARMNK